MTDWRKTCRFLMRRLTLSFRILSYTTFQAEKRGNFRMRLSRFRPDPSLTICQSLRRQRLFEPRRWLAAERAPEIDLYDGLAQDMPFPDETFDLVISHFVVHNILPFPPRSQPDHLSIAETSAPF
jgi:hypothetical protein